MADFHGVNILQIPLYKLFYLDEVSDNPLTPNELTQISKDYSAEKVHQIVCALEWAEQHPDYPFATLLPRLPYSNQEAHRYLVNLLRQMKEIGLS